jgi:hypothetical protein
MTVVCVDRLLTKQSGAILVFDLPEQLNVLCECFGMNAKKYCPVHLALLRVQQRRFSSVRHIFQ